MAKKSNSRLIADLKSMDNNSVDFYQVSLQLKEILEKKLPIEEFGKWMDNIIQLLQKYNINFNDYIRKLEFLKSNEALTTEFFRYWFGGRVSRNIVRKDVVIDDPDRDKCLGQLADIRRISSDLADSELLNSIPNYRNLFFGTVDSTKLTDLNAELESVVAELGNSRDRIELDMLNGFPVLPYHGVQPPFAKEWANRLIGIVFPLGLLFELRAWLFSKKLKWQMLKTIQTVDNITGYMNNNKQSK